MSLDRRFKIPKNEQYQDFVYRTIRSKVFFKDHPVDIEFLERFDELGHSVKTITFQVTENCNLRCSYCYQICKSKEKLDINLAKEFIDFLIKESYKDDSDFSIKKTAAIIIEFIGGEPLLELDLIDDIYDYFRNRLIEEKHPWAIYNKISMISNGVKYMEDSTQDFLKKNEWSMSFNISLDGCKELHDACRVFPDGSGSYDIAVEACKHYMNTYPHNMSTKMTLAPENISHTFDALTNLINLGYNEIHSNCVYEDVWDNSIHPKILYEQMKKFSDYLFDNDLEQEKVITLYNEGHFKPYLDNDDDDKNYCGSNCSMVAINNDGFIYPCIRFMKSSLGNDVKPYAIGTIKDGLGKSNEEKEHYDELYSITRTSQFSEKCNNCQIAKGCGWCTAYNYQVTGSVNKHVETICGMHQARALANVYFWNKFYIKNNEMAKFEMHIPKEWALEIIDEVEYNMLLDLIKQNEERINEK